MVHAFDYLPPAESFLDAVRSDAHAPDKARAVVIPFGLEASVSYGSGTAAGPAAILAASQQLELYDCDLGREAYADYGIAALKPQPIPPAIPAALDQLAATVGAVLDAGRFPFVLGGEHALTAGAIRPFAARYRDLVVVQFDAHADLRDGYQGQHYSHASAMRRVLDQPNVALLSIGIRAVCQAEVDFAAANADRITIHWGRDGEHYDTEAIVAPLKGRPIYLTFDIDALDGAIMPATGTPTPGGLSWRQSLGLLRAVCDAGPVVGADLVEFAPIPGLHAYDFMAAELAYKMLNFALSGTRPR
jgi:agmatinase